jgi:protein-disulfide isomerase
MSHRPTARAAVALLSLSSLLLSIQAQDAKQPVSPPPLPSVQEQIDALKQSQERILKELAELKKMLEAKPDKVAFAPVPQTPNLITLNVLGEPFRGDAQAKVAIVEYSDFECPICGSYARAIFPRIQTEYIQTGKIKYYFRDYPLPVHPNALAAARAARCAGEQERFWEMHDLLFADQTVLGTEDGLNSRARLLGLDIARFTECMNSNRYAENIRRSARGAERMGLEGTPAFLLGAVAQNGDVVRATKVLMGAESFESFKTNLDEFISDQNK